MTNFKKVIEIEKKYELIINNSKSKSEKDIDKFKEDLIIKQEAIKQDYLKELENNYIKAISDFNKEGELITKKAKEEIEYLQKNAKKQEAKEILLEAIENV